MPIKIENGTKYGVTDAQLVKLSLGLGTASATIDTTLNLPANSILDYVYIKPTSAAVISGFGSGHRQYVSNVILSASGDDMPMLSTDLGAASNFLNMTNGIVVSGATDSGAAVAMLGTGTSDIQIEVTVVGTVNTEATVDVMVGYRTFDTS